MNEARRGSEAARPPRTCSDVWRKSEKRVSNGAPDLLSGFELGAIAQARRWEKDDAILLTSVRSASAFEREKMRSYSLIVRKQIPKSGQVLALV